MKKNMSRVEASLSAKLVESEAKREKAEKLLEEATKNMEKRLEETNMCSRVFWRASRIKIKINRERE